MARVGMDCHFKKLGHFFSIYHYISVVFTTKSNEIFAIQRKRVQSGEASFYSQL